MKLIEGVKLEFRTSYDNQSVMINNVEYLDNSYTPNDNWISLNEVHENILFDNASIQKCFNKIIIDDIPLSIKKIMVELNISESNSRDEVFRKFSDNPKFTLNFESKMIKYLRTFCKTNDDFKLYKMLVLYPNRKTTAFIDFDNGIKYLGLHYDSCTTFEIETAHNSKNSLNLGKEDRELYFVNLSLVQIKELILKKNALEIVTLKNITPLFFKYYPDYPVLKLKIKPFQYYIAPTDNCIHEGTTLRKKEIDISITYLGYFTKI